MSDGLNHLGREFLTWLWYAAESNADVVDVDGVGFVRVLFAQRMLLTSLGPAQENSSIASDSPALTDEARAALKTGKKVAKATLLLDLDERHFEVTVDAATFALSGVKLPTVISDHEEERLAERLSLLDELESVLDGLYLQFARLRLDEPAWYQTRVAMHAWVTSDYDPSAAEDASMTQKAT